LKKPFHFLIISPFFFKGGKLNRSYSLSTRHSQSLKIKKERKSGGGEKKKSLQRKVLRNGLVRFVKSSQRESLPLWQASTFGDGEDMESSFPLGWKIWVKWSVAWTLLHR